MKPEQKVYLITRMGDRVFSFLMKNGKPVEIHCDNMQEESILGNIYIARVKNISKNIGAAFVETEPGRVCYLPLKELVNPFYTKKGNSPHLQQGDELVVQVCRDEIKSKFPSVTTNITLHSQYVLLTAGNKSISVSKKIAEEERLRLRSMGEVCAREVCVKPEPAKLQSGEPDSEVQKSTDESKNDCGWLIRTNAAGIEENTLKTEMRCLWQEYSRIIAKAGYRSLFSCLRRTPPKYLARLTDLYRKEADQILTDCEEIYEQIREHCSVHNIEEDRLALYQNRLLPLNKLYSLEHHLKEALSERVWLKSGGNLVIQPTEALTVIDVNTGKYEGGKDREKTFLKINLEAGEEIARQLRLRNISGIIIVDFINMEREESEKQLVSALRGHLAKDPLQAVFVDITKLSLVEITRKKKEKSLYEQVYSGAVQSSKKIIP